MRHAIACRVEHQRRGLTLTEVVVVVIAVLLLMSLVLSPYSVRSGDVSRRVQCLNNLKNLGLAATNYALGNGGQFPLLAGPAPGVAATNSQGNLQTVTWVFALMPYMDRGDTHEYVQLQTTSVDATAAVNNVLGGKGLGRLTPLSPSYAFLQCPQDTNRFKVPGGLSYGANIGYGAWRGTPEGVVSHYDFGATDHNASAVDWNNNGKRDANDKQFARATGVFWHADADGSQITLEDINDGDGTGTTLLFIETMTLPLMHEAGPAKNGLNPRALDVGTGLGIDALGLKKGAKPSLFVDRASPASTEYNSYFKPSAEIRTKPGNWPAASSMHKDVINVVFADGHAQPISTDINWAVWAALHTPSGVQHGEVKTSEAEF